jgi:putative aldouronate transport system substrate-binding protein
MLKKFFMASSLAITLVLAGCGGSSNQTAPTCPEQDNSEYIIDNLDNKPTINFLGQSAGNFDPTKDPTAAVVERLTGYEVKYNQLPSASADASLNTQLGSGTKYHAVKVTKNQYEYLVRQCALLDLSDYIDAYGTNIKNAISDESWSVVEYNEGIYGIPERSSSDNINWTIVLRKDWLDGLDLEVPETPEEFKAVLKAFEDHYGKNNNEFVPFTLAKPNILVPTIASAFGIYTEWQEVDGVIYNQAEHPAMPEYIDYMASLTTEGLIDKTAATYEFNNALQKFTSGNAGAIVAAWWNIPTIVETLDAANQIGAELAYVQPLEDENGDSGILRQTGVSYVTVIPNYMAKDAPYAIDWIDKKLAEESFREIVIGTEGNHYMIDRQGNYIPRTNFSEKEHSDYFITGSYEPKYPEYWLARVRKSEDLYNAWYALNEDADEVGVYDPLAFAPALEVTSQYKQPLGNKLLDDLVKMIVQDKSSTNYQNFLDQWNNNGGKVSHDEVNEWYSEK